MNGRRILITGGTRGIGLAIATRFAEDGDRVVIQYRADREQADDALASLPGDGHLALACEIADPDACRALVSASVDHLGGLDVLVNNAGIFETLDLSGVSYEDFLADWQRTLGVNLQGPACLSFLAARHMIEGGAIVNVSSRGAFRGEPHAPAYGASKAGLNALTQSLAQALGPRGITVAAVAPGFVETDMTREILAGPEGDAIRAQSSLGRVARPEDVAQAVMFLSDPRSSFSTGTIIDVNGASYLR